MLRSSDGAALSVFTSGGVSVDAVAPLLGALHAPAPVTHGGIGRGEQVRMTASVLTTIGLALEFAGFAILATDVLDVLDSERSRLEARQKRVFSALANWTPELPSAMSATRILLDDDDRSTPVRMEGGDMGSLKRVLSEVIGDLKPEPHAIRELLSRRKLVWTGVVFVTGGFILQCVGSVGF